jgi:hypothetical protein
MWTCDEITDGYLLADKCLGSPYLADGGIFGEGNSIKSDGGRLRGAVPLPVLR